MKKGKYQNHTAKHVRGSFRTVSLLLAMILLIGGVVGGTVAWLVDQTDEVVNTFTYGDIDITLTETDTNKDDDKDPNTNQYEMIPGSEITKDPKVTVKADSEDSWLFVKLVKSANFDDFMTYEMAEGWTALDGVDGVYYREVATDAADQEFAVLKDNKVTVPGSVTKAMLNELDANGTSNNPNYPTLTVTAYAVQKENIGSAADAWDIVENNNTTTTP